MRRIGGGITAPRGSAWVGVSIYIYIHACVMRNHFQESYTVKVFPQAMKGSLPLFDKHCRRTGLPPKFVVHTRNP